MIVAMMRVSANILFSCLRGPIRKKVLKTECRMQMIH